MTWSLVDAFEIRESVQAVFCDLSKAFDCVEHNILISKLKFYGFADNALNLIASYLTDRRQLVVINGQRSQTMSLKYGVPQGSVLGPILFLIAINDLMFNIPTSNIVFADDTTFMHKHNSLNELETLKNSTLTHVKSWFSANGFLLNESKTESLVFTLKQFDTHKCKMLGIVIDTKLTWQEHVNYISVKLSRVVYLLRRINKCVPHAYARAVYFAYFQSIIKYGLIIWGNSCHVKNVFLIQKMAIRTLTNSTIRTHCKPLFIKENIMTVTGLYILECALYCKSNMALLQSNKNLKAYGFRNIDNFEIPSCRLSKTISNHNVMALKVGNRLPGDIFKMDIKVLKSLLTDWLIRQSFYSLKEFFDVAEILI